MFIKVERVSKDDRPSIFPDGVPLPADSLVVDLAALERAISRPTPTRWQWWGEWPDRIKGLRKTR